MTSPLNRIRARLSKLERAQQSGSDAASRRQASAIAKLARGTELSPAEAKLARPYVDEVTRPRPKSRLQQFEELMGKGEHWKAEAESMARLRQRVGLPSVTEG